MPLFEYADDVCGPVSEDGVAAYCRGKGLL